MYCETFLTVCPACKTVQKNLLIDRNKVVPCIGCLSRFIAQENFIDIDEASPPHSTPTWADEEQFNDHIRPEASPSHPTLTQVNEEQGNDLRRRETSLSHPTPTLANEQGNDCTRVASPNDTQQEMEDVYKDLQAVNLGENKCSLEGDAAASKAALTKESMEEIRGGKWQQMTMECTDRTRNGKVSTGHKPLMSFNDDTEASEDESADLRKRSRGDTKMKRLKFTQKSATWGVALRKPIREKRKIRAYSPSRERTFRKKPKSARDAPVKNRRRKGAKANKQNPAESKRDCVMPDVSNGNIAPNVMTEKPMSDLGIFSDEFKDLLKEEIKRQILGGLGEACNHVELGVVEVEEIKRHPASGLHEAKDSELEEKQYMAKTRLMVTVFFPVTLQAGQWLSENGSKATDHHAETQEKELTEQMEAVRDLAAAGPMEPEELIDDPLFENENDGDKERERTEVVKDRSEADAAIMMELEKLDDDPLFENEDDDYKVPKPAVPVMEDCKVPVPAAPVMEEYKVPVPAAPVMDNYKISVPAAPVMEDYKVPVPAAPVMKDLREPKSAGPVEESRKSEAGGLMGQEKLNDDPLFGDEVNDDPLFENENDEEVDVPQAEFYDFECERGEEKFAPGQVWASYGSGRDMMPRDYVVIKKVISTAPFKVVIRLLKPTGSDEWVRRGNALACGDFQSDQSLRLMDQINEFSHIMKWVEGRNGTIRIYPAEGDVWALYRDWKETNPHRRIKMGYDIVRIIAASDPPTVTAVPLINYKRSRTVFIQQKVEPFEIHEKDFCRFSHQIPTYDIFGLEGCLELDPAATPQCHWD